MHERTLRTLSFIIIYFLMSYLTSLNTKSSGYMAPEYVMHGQFSVKSDVYSLGVLILEITSGQKNNCFHVGENTEYLLTHVSMNREVHLSFHGKAYNNENVIELYTIDIEYTYISLHLHRPGFHGGKEQQAI